MMSQIRVAIVGVGNCANSLMQGLQFYREMTGPGIGLVRPQVGPYRVKDIEIVTAYDVAESKVGYDLRRALWAPPNDTLKFAEIPYQDVLVQRGPTLDGLGQYLGQRVPEAQTIQASTLEQVTADFAQCDVVVNYLPVGSQVATEFYAKAALAAGGAFVNCIPVFIASSPLLAGAFTRGKVPIIGDDIKSQVGATIVHRVLAQLFRDRGVKLDRTLQLNIGGNGDFLNMLERERLVSKKLSKTNAVVSIAGTPIAADDVHIGPSDYVSWLTDRKWAYIRLEGRGFGGAPLNIELKLEVWDSPNSAGIVIDAIRCAKLAKDRGEGGPIDPACAYFMKSPPQQMDDDKALTWLEDWIAVHSAKEEDRESVPG